MTSQPYTSFDIITLHNVDSEEFIFEYDRSGGNPPYSIPAGEARRFPRFLAEHALKHLIDKILTKQDKKINNEVARQELASQIVIEEESFQRESQPSEAERLRAEVEKLNKPSDLDAVLAKARPPQAEVTSPLVFQEPVVEEKFEGLEQPLKGDEVDTTIVAPPPVKGVKPVPTRQEILDYGKNVLKLEFDDKTKDKLDKMKVAELLSEIGDPREIIE